MSSAASPNVIVPATVKVGSPVLVAFFNGQHVKSTAVAHVTAVGPVDEKTNQPTISVTFPTQPADERKLASARWPDAYTRQTGVQHYSHPDVQAGKLPVAYGGEFEVVSEPSIPQPAGSGDNPIFDRHIIDPAAPKVTEAIAAQQGKMPEGSHASPVASEAGTVHNATAPAATAETSTAASTEAPAPKETEGQVLQNLADAVEGKSKKS